MNIKKVYIVSRIAIVFVVACAFGILALQGNRDKAVNDKIRVTVTMDNTKELGESHFVIPKV